MGWLSGWGKRIKITIDNTKVDSVLTDFPVLIHLSTSSGTGSDDVSCVFDELGSDSNRKKIAVTTADGTTQCYVEIEKWDDANEEAWLWVKVPSVSSSADTDLYLYYDSSQADNTTYVGDTGDTVAQNVWDSDFLVVCHLEQDPSSENILDSTANGLDGAPTASITTTTGKIGQALVFNGSDNQVIDFGSDSKLDITTSFTVETIMIYNTTASGTHSIYACGDTDFGALFFRWDGSKLSLNANPNGTERRYEPSKGASASHRYIAGSHDISDINVINLYVDDVKDSSTRSSNSRTHDFYHGRIGGDGSHGSGKIAMTLTEFRLSKVKRSDAWMKATYYTCWDDLIAFGAEECNKLSVEPLTVTISAVAALQCQLSVNPIAGSLSLHCPSLFVGAPVAAEPLILIAGGQADTSIQIASSSLNVVTGLVSTPSLILPAESITLTTSLLTSQVLDVKFLPVEPITLQASIADIDFRHGISCILPLALSGQLNVQILLATQALELSCLMASPEVWDGTAWQRWIDQYGAIATKYYYFTLTGDNESPPLADIMIPMSSFQARRKSGEPTFLSVVLPGTSMKSDIEARVNGEMIIEMAYELNGTIEYREEILRVDFERLREDTGGRNQSLTLQGHKTESFVGKTIWLTDVMYKRDDDGDLAYRCASCDLYLNPGDTARYGSDSFTVNQIVLSISPEMQTMDVEESAT